MYISSHTLRASNKTLNESDQQCHNADESERKKNGKKDKSTNTNSIYRSYTAYPYMKDYFVYCDVQCALPVITVICNTLK